MTRIRLGVVGPQLSLPPQRQVRAAARRAGAHRLTGPGTLIPRVIDTPNGRTSCTLFGTLNTNVFHSASFGICVSHCSRYSALITPCRFPPPKSLHRSIARFSIDCSPATSLHLPASLYRSYFSALPPALRWHPLTPPFSATTLICVWQFLLLQIGILGPALRAGSQRSATPWSRRRGQPRAPPAPGPGPAPLSSRTGSPLLATSRSRRRGCPPSWLPGPPPGWAPSTLGFGSPSGARATLARGLRGYVWSRLGQLQRITSPPGGSSPHHGFPHLRHVPPSRIAVRLCAFRKADWLIRCQMRWGQRKGKLRVFPRRAGSARIPAPSSWEGRSTAVRARSPHGAATRD